MQEKTGITQKKMRFLSINYIDKSSLVKILGIIILSRLLLILSAEIGIHVLGIQNDGTWVIDIPIIGSFARWDAAYYLSIASLWYSDECFLAFRPLFPALIRYISLLVFKSTSWENLIIVSFVVNFLLTILSFYILYRLTLLYYGRDVSFKTVLQFVATIF